MTDAKYRWAEPLSLSVAGDPAGANEDALAVTASSLIMIDGATGLTAGRMSDWPSDARWFAHGLAVLLRGRLDQAAPIASILRTCIEDLREEYGRPDRVEIGPSACVLIARVSGANLEVYSLGDCLALIGRHDGDVTAIRDDAVSKLDAVVMMQLQALRGDRSLAEAKPLVAELLVANRTRRNTPQGYWIADLSADGVDHALTFTARVDEIRDIALMTDGFAAALDVVGSVGSAAELLEQLRSDGPDVVMTALSEVLRSDPECVIHPRLKPMDDSSVIIAALA